MSIGSQWKELLVKGNRAAEQAKREEMHRAQKAEASQLIERIPATINQAIAQGKDEIPFLNNRCLNSTDVACGDVDAFVDTVADRPVRAEQLAGVALLVFYWCDQNDLACYVKGLGKIAMEHEYTLIAKPK